jgi:hypothetical protein
MLNRIWNWIELILMIVGFLYTMIVLVAGFILLIPVLILFERRSKPREVPSDDGWNQDKIEPQDRYPG